MEARLRENSLRYEEEIQRLHRQVEAFSLTSSSSQATHNPQRHAQPQPSHQPLQQHQQPSPSSSSQPPSSSSPAPPNGLHTDRHTPSPAPSARSLSPAPSVRSVASSSSAGSSYSAMRAKRLPGVASGLTNGEAAHVSGVAEELLTSVAVSDASFPLMAWSAACNWFPTHEKPGTVMEFVQNF